jgi:hypothetical protein
MIELTPQQRQELTSSVPEAVDPETKEIYVLVRRHLYERLKALLSEDYDPDSGMVLMNEVMAEDDANDPLLESYQRFAKDRS